MHFTSETSSDGVSERRFVHDGVPGVLWHPAGSALGARPLVLLAHGGGQHKLGPRDRARRCAARYGWAAVAIDAPGHGERERTAQDERFATEVGELLAAGRPISAWVARHTAALAERAVPEWRAVLDALEALDGEGLGPVGYWGLSLGTVIGIPLAAVEPRIRAAVFGLAGHASLVESAGRLSVPVRFVLQWDDELQPREAALALYGALGSREKTLHANPGGHLAVPEFEVESAERFLGCHLPCGAR
ncbi:MULTISPECIES: dienelactone hydrolase family protein [Kitasatospora]|uniref:Alpha/beta fold hydrolase n=1 Tax=Kitasatospora cathayae TaxID=3004092 RepID=A0ABY7Q1M7_9ACTN|nr:alpha/beta fold hydrolase [Kitasatospora sp. HUAS 3-15]WBP86061.1 alpha/beta fold hydrolase [Kitasatospora sp. HUAS 3-15]